MITSEQILEVLDDCAAKFQFPMLDNGYVYLAATRLSLFRSSADWALVIEVFGFSPRAGLPDTFIYTFGSRLTNRDTPDQYVTLEAYENYRTKNPHNETHIVFPVAEGSWQDAENCEILAAEVSDLALRGNKVSLPERREYAARGIELAEEGEIAIFELCRYLAAVHRDEVLATAEERRTNVPVDLEQILVLDEWHHPDVAEESVRVSDSETFQQLAAILTSGNLSLYDPSVPPNTHWSHWPDGGTL